MTTLSVGGRINPQKGAPEGAPSYGAGASNGIRTHTSPINNRACCLYTMPATGKDGWPKPPIQSQALPSRLSPASPGRPPEVGANRLPTPVAKPQALPHMHGPDLPVFGCSNHRFHLLSGAGLPRVPVRAMPTPRGGTATAVRHAYWDSVAGRSQQNIEAPPSPCEKRGRRGQFLVGGSRYCVYGELDFGETAT